MGAAFCLSNGISAEDCRKIRDASQGTGGRGGMVDTSKKNTKKNEKWKTQKKMIKWKTQKKIKWKKKKNEKMENRKNGVGGIETSFFHLPGKLIFV